MLDPYVTLGVSKTASPDEIKDAYRTLAKKYHPDLNPGKKEAEQRFKEVNEAYEILSDPKKKEEYERRGEEASYAGWQAGPQSDTQYSSRGPFYWQASKGGGGRYSEQFGGSFEEDFFANLFGRMKSGRSAGDGESFSVPGQDVKYSLTVSFKDAILGSEQTLAFPDGKKLRIKIPKGIESGKMLRIPGQGVPGMNGGPPGDAYIAISVSPSDLFQRNGNDIELELPISLSEAVLGAEIRVPTLEEDVLLKIPPGVTSGSKLRIRGKGVPVLNENRTGDEIVKIKIVMPKTIDPQLEKVIREWSQTHSYNPRSEFEFRSGKEGTYGA
jgi:DnaJ-class molecular chaperone